MNQNLIITPKTKVGELLDAYPHLEEILMELSPAFKKLKSPILRKTVAKVATLQQAAAIGSIKVDELVNKLRSAVGQDMIQEAVNLESYTGHTPQWFDEIKIKYDFDASPVINAGGSPMKDILDKAKQLGNNEILKLTTPFIPAPIIDKLKNSGFETFSVQNSKDIFFTYICKK